MDSYQIYDDYHNLYVRNYDQVIQINRCCETPKTECCEAPKIEYCETPKIECCEQPKTDCCKQPKNDCCEQPKNDCCEEPKIECCELPKTECCEPPIEYECVVTYRQVAPIKTFGELCFDWTYIIIIIITFLIYIPFFISYFAGINSAFNINLKTDTTNTWVIGGLWIITTIISYVGFYILWRNPTPELITRNLIISVLYFIGNVILLIFAVTFYQFESIAVAVWIALVLFIYQFWMFIYIWNINRIAAIFFLPSVAMYIYFFYSMVHLAFLNDIPL